MPSVEHPALIGLGAVGALYAVLLHRHLGEAFRVLMDEPRLRRYEREPLVFNGQSQRFNYQVPKPGSPKADLILVATKASGFDAALEAMTPLVGPGTVILPLLNGIASEAQAAKRFGWERVLRAFVVGHTSMRHGRNVAHDGVMELVFGEADNTAPSERVRALQEFFGAAGIPCRVPKDMAWAQWSKFVANVGLNQASAMLEKPWADFQRPGPGRDLVAALLREAARVARAEGLNDTETMVAAAETLLDGLPPTARCSMLQDVDNGVPTEVDAFAGEVCRLARKHGLAAPANEAVLAHFGMPLTN